MANPDSTIAYMHRFASFAFAGLAGASLATTGCPECIGEGGAALAADPAVRVGPMRHLQRPTQQDVEARHSRIWHGVAADFAEALDANTAPHRSTGPAPPHRGDHCGHPICGPRSLARWPPPKMFVYIDPIETHGPDGEAAVLARLPPTTNMPVYDIAKRSPRSVANHHGRTPS